MNRTWRTIGLASAFLAAITVIAHPQHVNGDRAHHNGQACVVCRTPSFTPEAAVSLEIPRFVALEPIIVPPQSVRSFAFPLTTHSRAPPAA